MAILYTNEFQKAYVDKPDSKLSPAELNGRLRRGFAEVTLGAEIVVGDILKVMKIPANAVPVMTRVVAPGGTGGTLNLGWGAGSVEAGSVNGLIAGMSGAAALDELMAFSDAGHNKRFSEDVDMELSVSVDTVGFTGDLVQIEMWYIID